MQMKLPSANFKNTWPRERNSCLKLQPHHLLSSGLRRRLGSCLPIAQRCQRPFAFQYPLLRLSLLKNLTVNPRSKKSELQIWLLFPRLMGVDGQIGRGNLWYLTVEANHAGQVCLTTKGRLGTFYIMEPWDRSPESGRIYSFLFICFRDKCLYARKWARINEKKNLK